MDEPRLHLYVDATIAANGAIRTLIFGPFADRAEAERAVTAFIGREDAMGATIRDPDASVPPHEPRPS